METSQWSVCLCLGVWVSGCRMCRMLSCCHVVMLPCSRAVVCMSACLRVYQDYRLWGVGRAPVSKLNTRTAMSKPPATNLPRWTRGD